MMKNGLIFFIGNSLSNSPVEIFNCLFNAENVPNVLQREKGLKWSREKFDSIWEN